MCAPSGRIERYFLDTIGKTGISVERGVMPTKLEFDESLADESDAYPVTITLRHLSEDEATPKQSATSANGAGIEDGLFRSNMAADDTEDIIRKAELNNKANTVEVVKAKYVLGADGAHSWVRNQLGFKLEGESTDYIWGVLDIIPITDFPDIRMRCAIHSASSGSVMVIPRESKLVRLYIQLTTTNAEGVRNLTDRRSPRISFWHQHRRSWPHTRSLTVIAIGGRHIRLVRGWAQISVLESESSSLEMQYIHTGE